MGSCIPSSNKKGRQSKGSLKVADNFILKLSQEQYYLNIKLQPINKKQKGYDLFYDDNSLPNEIYKYIKSVKGLKQTILKDKDNIYIKKNSLVFSFNNTQLSLDIKSQYNQEDIVLQCQQHIKKVEHINKISRPFSSIVKIKSYFKSGNTQFTLQGSGVIIKNNIILTVAHNIFNRQYQAQTYKTEIFIYISNESFKKLKVLKSRFSDQYKNNNLTDLHRYDLAFLQVEKNDLIKDQQIMPIAFDAIDNNTSFQIIGFSQIIDKADQKKEINNIYNIKCKRPIKLFQDFIQYMQKAKSGMSGGGIIITDKNGKHKLVGLHQGLKQNYGRGILFSNKSKNSYQLLGQMSSFNHQTKALFNQNNKQKRNPQDHYQHKNQNLQHSQNIGILNKAKEYYGTEKYDQCYQLLSQIQKQNVFGQKSTKFAEVLFFIGKVKIAFAQQLKQYLSQQNLSMSQKSIKQKEIISFYESSLKYFQKSYQIIRLKIGAGAVDQQTVVQNLIQLAKVYQTPQLEDSNKALQQYEKAFKIYQKTQFQSSENYFQVIYQMALLNKHIAMAQIQEEKQKLQMKNIRKALQLHQLCLKNLQQKNKEIKQKFYLQVILSLNECNQFIYMGTKCKDNCQQCQQCKSQFQIFINSFQTLLKCYQYQKDKSNKSNQFLILLAKIGYLSGLSKNYMNQAKYYQQYKKLYQEIYKIQKNQNKYDQNIIEIQESSQAQVDTFYELIVIDLLRYYQSNTKYKLLKDAAFNMKKYLQKKNKKYEQIYFTVTCAYGRSLTYLDFYKNSLQLFNQLNQFYCNSTCHEKSQKQLYLKQIAKQIKKNQKKLGI